MTEACKVGEFRYVLAWVLGDGIARGNWRLKLTDGATKLSRFRLLLSLWGFCELLKDIK